MIEAIEVQIISKILTCEDEEVVDALLAFQPDMYFSSYKKEITYIHDHKAKYDSIVSTFGFLAQFPEFNIVQVPEGLEELVAKLKEYRQYLLLIETFNKVKDLGDGDVKAAWQYIGIKAEEAMTLESNNPMNIVKDVSKRAEQIKEYNKQQRIPTGFNEIDRVMYGGLSTVEELLVLIARTNSGKAQPLWSKILTPKGWTTMGDIKIGDEVIGLNNDNGKVIKIFPQGQKEYYRVNFDDGTYAECCDDHLWTVLNRDRRWKESPNYRQHLVLTTKEIRESLDKKYSIDISNFFKFDSDFDEEAELGGYLMGLLLCDTSSIKGTNLSIYDTINRLLDSINLKCDECRNRDCTFCKNNKLKYTILDYQLANSVKLIPEQYFTAPIYVRKSLLAGLLDMQGYCIKNSSFADWFFSTSSKSLAYSFATLARTLSIWAKVEKGKEDNYQVMCRSNFNPFTNKYKAKFFEYKHHAYTHYKMIESIEYVGTTECQCILLDNKTHTYITDGYTVTHNSWVCTKMMESAQKHGFPAAYYSPEMQSAYLGTRFDTWRMHFENNKLFRGDYSTEYYKYMKELEQEETPAFVIEDKDYPDGVSVRSLEPFVKKHGIKLLVIDGISYMRDDFNAIRDQEKFKNIAMGLFTLSKKYGCACVLVMQANREVKSKDDKGEPIPTLYNAEGSDQPGRIATQAFGIRQIFDKHILDIGLLKSRMADNRTPVFSYSWDINTGQLTYIPSDTESDFSGASAPTIQSSMSTPNLSFGTEPPSQSSVNNVDDDEDIEF